MLQLGTTEAEKLLQLATMVLTEPTHTAPAAYLFAETHHNKYSVIDKGVELLQSCVVTELLLHDARGEKNQGYRGIEEWKQDLSERGVLPSQVTPVPCFELGHTLSEAMALVKHANERNWEKLVVVAPPFHQLRTFISMVTAINFLGNKTLRVYNQVGSALSWNEEVLHSQGILQASRADLIVEELRRIKRYQRQSKWMRFLSDTWMFLKAAVRSGTLFEKLHLIPHYGKQCSSVPLVATSEVLEYLKWRDRE